MNNMINNANVNNTNVTGVGPTAATGGSNPQTVTFTYTFSSFSNASSGTFLTLQLN
jgi:hypothetical protein